jgi:hypothetical protein
VVCWVMWFSKAVKSTCGQEWFRRVASTYVRSRLNQVEATILTTTNWVLILNKKAMRIRVIGGEDKGA